MDDYGDSINSSKKPKELQKEKNNSKAVGNSLKGFRNDGKVSQFQRNGKGFTSGKKDAKVLECQERFK